jgi:hypothetical protein
MILIKLILSSLIIVGATEAGKRSGKLGGLLLSLPLTSILALSWSWWETRDAEKTAQMTTETLWFIVPSLVLFLALPVLIRRGMGFPWAMTLSVIFTLGSYVLFFKLRA